MRTSCTARGFTILELLLGLSVCAALLTAVAFALNASIQAYHANSDEGLATNHARMVMIGMMQQIRQTEYHTPQSEEASEKFVLGHKEKDASGKVIGIADSALTVASLYAPNGKVTSTEPERTVGYSLDRNKHQIVMSVNGSEQPILRGVKNFEVRFFPRRSRKAWEKATDEIPPYCDSVDSLSMSITMFADRDKVPNGEAAGQQAPAGVVMTGSSSSRRVTWSGMRLSHSIEEIKDEEDKH